MEYIDSKIEVKNITEEGVFTGYGSVFDIVDYGADVVTKTAFDRSIKEISEGKRRPKMLWQHDPDQPIGVWQKFTKDDHGLKVEGKLSLRSAKGAEIHALLLDGAIDSMSIGYKTVDYEMVKSDSGEKIRHLKDVDLWEVSLVTFPMNADALVTDVKQLQSARDVEFLLRKEGVPGTFAKLLALYGYEGAIAKLNSHDDGVNEAEAQCKKLLTQLQGLKEAFHA